MCTETHNNRFCHRAGAGCLRGHELTTPLRSAVAELPIRYCTVQMYRYKTSFVQGGPGRGCGGHGDAGAGPGDMDLTRRQRDQRKKDIREKVRTSDI